MTKVEHPKCKFCKKNLQPQYKHNYNSIEKTGPNGGLDISYVESIGDFLGYGHQANGHFCTAKCGFRFAVQLLDSKGKVH